MRRFRITILLLLISLPAFAVVSTPVTRRPVTTTSADGTTSETVITTADQDTLSFRDRLFDAPNRPKWATRTFIGFGGQRQNTPVSEFVTTQPFSLNDERVYFWQGRAAYQYGELTGNIGLGYRFLNEKKNILWGMNAFFDDATAHKFKRYGVGGELFASIFVVRGNYYKALNGSANIYHSPITNVWDFQRPLSGYDLSIEAPVPLYSWARVFGEGYQYFTTVEKGMNGGGAGFRLFLAKAVELDVGFLSDNVNGNQTYAKAEYYFGGADFIQYALTTDAYGGSIAYLDLVKQMMQRVIRNNQLVLQTTYDGHPDETNIKVRAW